MRKQSSPVTSEVKQSAESARESPLSLNRLREAFAAMMGRQESPNASDLSTRDDRASSDGGPSVPLQDAPCEINPRSVVEAMLFVGRPDNGSISSRELAAAMRGVSPAEIDSAVAELDVAYQ